MRVLTVVGARPQFVKAAPVSRALRRRHEERLLHTGQHYDAELSGVFVRELGIPEPDTNLGVGSGPTGTRMAAVVRGIARELDAVRCDAVLVYGDTDSTLGGALAAREAGVPLVHVEAGLRSGDMGMPEERNRIAADHLAALLLCPTVAAAETLRNEGASGDVRVVGDVMLDGCLAAAEAARRIDVTAEYGVAPGAYYAATLHRAENTDDPARLRSIVAALDGLDAPVVLPCHPRTRAALLHGRLLDGRSSLRLIEPSPYAHMLALVLHSRGLLTDSGGLQKEAYFLSVPCVTLRDTTEWPETLVDGWNVLVGADRGRIHDAIAGLERPATPPDLEQFGGGRAADAVADAVCAFDPGA